MTRQFNAPENKDKIPENLQKQILEICNQSFLTVTERDRQLNEAANTNGFYYTGETNIPSSKEELKKQCIKNLEAMHIDGTITVEGYNALKQCAEKISNTNGSLDNFEQWIKEIKALGKRYKVAIYI